MMPGGSPLMPRKAEPGGYRSSYIRQSPTPPQSSPVSLAPTYVPYIYLWYMYLYIVYHSYLLSAALFNFILFFTLYLCLRNIRSSMNFVLVPFITRNLFTVVNACYIFFSLNKQNQRKLIPFRVVFIKYPIHPQSTLEW